MQQTTREESPAVSIIMPVFNSFDFVRSEGKQLLPEALNSLLAQSFTNFELIVLDNRSIDATADVCKSFAARDSRVRYLLDGERRPPEAAITHLSTHARGKFVMIANDDDQWAPTFIGKMMAVLSENPDVHLAYANGRYIDIEGGLRQQFIPSNLETYDRRMSALSNFCKYIEKRNIIPIAFGLYRIEAFLKTMPMLAFDELKANVDNLFMSKFMLRGHKVAFLNEELFFYRQKQRKLDPDAQGATVVVDMPSLDQPIAIWFYYVRHQFFFFEKIVALIQESEWTALQRCYVKCVALDSCIRVTSGLLDWIWRDVAQAPQGREIGAQIREVYAQVIASKLINLDVMFESTGEDGERLQPAAVYQKLSNAVSLIRAMSNILDTFGSKLPPSPILLSLGDILRSNVLQFENEMDWLRQSYRDGSTLPSDLVSIQGGL